MEAELNNKSDNYIQLKENKSILKLWIRDEKGNEILEKEKKARLDLRNQIVIIEKKQDHKGKKLFSSQEEAKLKATKEFFEKEVEIYNMFLGENGVQKLLNGDELSWSTLDIIDEIIEKQIMPQLKINAEDIKTRIMKKYSNNKRDDVIE